MFPENVYWKVCSFLCLNEIFMARNALCVRSQYALWHDHCQLTVRWRTGDVQVTVRPRYGQGSVTVHSRSTFFAWIYQTQISEQYRALSVSPVRTLLLIHSDRLLTVPVVRTGPKADWYTTLYRTSLFFKPFINQWNSAPTGTGFWRYNGVLRHPVSHMTTEAEGDSEMLHQLKYCNRV